MQEKFQKIKIRFQELQAEQKSLKNLIVKLEQDHGRLTQRVDRAEKAQVIIRRVALKTQKNLEYHFSDLVSTALLAVSSKWPEFVVNMKESKRSHGESELLFKEEGKTYDPSWGGECIFLEPTGCSLQLKHRPRECRLLEPKKGGKECVAHDNTGKNGAALAWRNYFEILNSFHED